MEEHFEGFSQEQTQGEPMSEKERIFREEFEAAESEIHNIHAKEKSSHKGFGFSESMHLSKTHKNISKFFEYVANNEDNYSKKELENIFSLEQAYLDGDIHEEDIKKLENYYINFLKQKNFL